MDLIESAKYATYYSCSLETLQAMYDASKRTQSAWQVSSKEDCLLLVEQHIYLSLLTCHDVDAKSSLNVFVDLLGPESSRVAAAKAAVLEAISDEATAKEYINSLPENVETLTIKKRSLTHYKSEGQWPELVTELCKLAKIHPSDVEIWAELSDAYAFTGNYDKAAQALLQALIITPLAYPLYARIAELYHLDAQAMRFGVDAAMESMQKSISNACRSVELCPNYARGWSMILVATSKLVQWPKTPNMDTYTGLLSKSKDALKRIVDSRQGTPEDLAAAKAVLRS